LLLSVSIRANQHVESLQGQARLIAQQRDEIQLKLSAAEDQIHHHSAALCNLQIVLEQFQKGQILSGLNLSFICLVCDGTSCICEFERDQICSHMRNWLD